MTELESRTIESMGKGVAAGIAGTIVMFAVRSFDQRYAAKNDDASQAGSGIGRYRQGGNAQRPAKILAAFD